MADGYFVIPYTVGDYLADDIRTGPIDTKTPEFDEAEKAVKDRIDHFLNNKGTKPVDDFHRRLGKVMWDKCGMARNAEGLKEAIVEIRKIREEFWKDVRVPGKANEFNQELEKAGRVADFLELGELMCMDALDRNESCGGHFREEYARLEARRKARPTRRRELRLRGRVGMVWVRPESRNLHKEELTFDVVKLTQRSYK